VKQKTTFTILFSCFLLYSLAFSSCIESTLPTPILAPTLSQTSLPTVTITTTPTLNYKTVIITPDDLFSLPGLKAWSTPDSGDFCEHLPTPQVVPNPDRFSLLSGRFVLCIYERTFTAMDLDTGSLVSSDDKSGEIILGSPGGGENPTYGVFGRNTAYVKDTYYNEAYSAHEGANKISYEYCENALQNQTDQGGMYVGEQFIGDIACVKTTEGQIALLRVEKIYPAVTLSVEFSFAILRNE
jgi:hypothetical protein